MMVVPANVAFDSLLAEFSDFVTAQTGLAFPRSAWRDLERGMAAAAKELSLPDAHSCMRWLLTAPVTHRHIQFLARHLTVGETYFFREKPALEVLEGRILPELIEARRRTTRRLRIWSAACCTGEEAYTIAILLNRLLPDWRDWNITILGTDINADFLKLASRGVYRDWSFRTTPQAIKERYFTPTAEGHAVIPEIKQMVTFAELNLAEAEYPKALDAIHDVDIIFCRNALMYFSPGNMAQVVANFHKALGDGGWLVVNPSEATPALFAQYQVVTQPDVILFRKGALPNAKVGIRVNAKQNPEVPPMPQPARSRVVAERPVVIHHAKLEQSAKPHIGGWELARTLYEQGQHLEAREKLLALAGQDTGDTRIFALLARIEANQGQLTSALGWSERATRADSMNPAHWYLRATVLQEQGALDEARTTLNRVLYLDPDFVLAYLLLGNISLQRGRTSEAMKYFNTMRSQLSGHKQDEILSGSEDLTVGQLDVIIATMLESSLRSSIDDRR